MITAVRLGIEQVARARVPVKTVEGFKNGGSCCGAWYSLISLPS
jgi:hypothetical protein